MLFVVAMLEIRDWGVTDYAGALGLQQRLVEKRIQGDASDMLIFTEHPAVFTLGRRLGAIGNLRIGQDELRNRGIGLVRSNRGGDITYHGPGQLVCYPIISLDGRRDLHRYLRDLEQVILLTLDAFGLEAERSPGNTGIWLERRKIAAIGVGVRKWVAFHGFSLNVEVDLAPYNLIIPCGIPASTGSVTSMHLELPAAPSRLEVMAAVVSSFRSVFGFS